MNNQLRIKAYLINMLLSNSCKYSFRDLVIASNGNLNIDEYLKLLYSKTQKERNEEVKKLCREAGWHFKDVIGTDGAIYTSFSPTVK